MQQYTPSNNQLLLSQDTGITKTLIQEDLRSKWTPELEAVYTTDIMEYVMPEASGISYKHSWVYSGGQGLAGVHLEDGFLHFVHHLISLELSLASGSLLERLVTKYMMLSSKVWVFYNQGGVDGGIELNKYVAKLFNVAPVVDELLASRMYVLDPRAFYDDPDFKVVTQYPGQYVHSDLPHSVTGCGFLSFACNILMTGSLAMYIKAEEMMAAAVRKSKGAYNKAWKELNKGGEEILRETVLRSELMLNFVKRQLNIEMMPSEVRCAIRWLYWEDEHKKHIVCASVKGDATGIPYTGADAQCELCGLGFVNRYYKCEGRLVCLECAKGKKVSTLKCADMYGTVIAHASGMMLV